MAKLSPTARKAMFAKLNSIGVSVTKTQRRKISKQLFNDNIAIARSKLKKGEKLVVHTNPNMEAFAFAVKKSRDKKSGDIRTIKFLGHKNKDNPVDVRVVPANE